ncbi:MAG: type II toxin-antitoxin system VapB family antitoxin [Candidatus Omnitrophica bacterium]|nr:type II toxin-antitoxin system VapB family antitoxin [Candidatus Omnitrophota bacterium]
MSRTVVNLQDDLVRKARKLTGLTKKVELVNFALARLIQQKKAEKILDLKGAVKWEGNLKAMRRNRFDFG